MADAKNAKEIWGSFVDLKKEKIIKRLYIGKI